jgi:hypothetical protein
MTTPNTRTPIEVAPFHVFVGVSSPIGTRGETTMSDANNPKNAPVAIGVKAIGNTKAKVAAAAIHTT